MQIDYRQAIEELDLLGKLAEFSPVVIGTPPLGIDIASSDIDIACSCVELTRFKNFSVSEFEKFDNFHCRDAILQDQDSIIIQFHALNWDIELFCQSLSTDQQWGVRHFKIEQKLLEIAPRLKAIVTDLKQNGIKTEPAFASALGLSGDPYSAMLDLENMTHDELTRIIKYTHPDIF